LTDERQHFLGIVAAPATLAAPGAKKELPLFKFLFRCVLFIVGLALIADTGLPIRVEQLRIDRHTSHTQADDRGFKTGDTSYTLHLIDGVVSSCSVGYALYTRLKDGDSIEVRSTRIFRNCIRISQGDDVMQDDNYWKYVGLIFGALLIASAVGWLRSDDEDDRSGIGIRLG